MRNLTLIYRCARRLALPRLWAAMSLLAAHTFLWAQTAPQPTEPYATIDRSSIDYAGPDRGACARSSRKRNQDWLDPAAHRRPQARGRCPARRRADGTRRRGRQSPLPAALRLELAPRDESGLWGRASSEIVKLVVDDRAIALVTSPDGRAAHLAEQVGNRLSVPVVSLASDSQNTQINIPWYFRMVPDDAAQARLFADDIYHRQGFQKVLLVTENDHDGRVGKEEFEKAARRLQAPELRTLGNRGATEEILPR